MKNFKSITLSFLVIGALLVFQNCGGDDEETPKDATTNMLKGKTVWVVSSVTVPANSATQDSDWDNFKVSFSSTMTTSDHPVGATAVWPSGSYSVSDDGRTLTRGDGIVMQLNPITATNFTARFSITGEDLGGARIASLDGEYTFNMK